MSHKKRTLLNSLLLEFEWPNCTGWVKKTDALSNSNWPRIYYGTLSIPIGIQRTDRDCTQYRMGKKTDTIEIQTSSIAFLQFDRR